MTTLPALPSTVADMVAEYDEKLEAIDAQLAAFNDAAQALQTACCIQGAYVGNVFDRTPYVHADRMKKLLLKSGWKAIYERLQIPRIASAQDKRLFDRTIEDPPALTFENAKATFGDYFMRPRFHILRGLAEVFASLDPAYRSHAKVKIGVKGLPKRVILRNFGSYGGSYGQDKLRDIVNALAAYRGEPLMEHTEMNAVRLAHDLGEDAVLDGRTYTRERRYGQTDSWATRDRGVTVRAFNNGNAHVFFDKHALTDINRALAEFYGEVLPDVDETGSAPQPSTAVAKDLQFYGSPPAVIDALLEAADIHRPDAYALNYKPDPKRVLEPSCGDGRILDAIARRGHKGLGIEVHAGRAAQARANGHAVQLANFLECPARPEFDRVVMNPPFYGRHYIKHVRHALKFLKPGGVLVAVLPATAWYDHGQLEGDWRDLPTASFAEAGTNVPTGILKIRVAAETKTAPARSIPQNMEAA